MFCIASFIVTLSCNICRIARLLHGSHVTIVTDRQSRDYRDCFLFSSSLFASLPSLTFDLGLFRVVRIAVPDIEYRFLHDVSKHLGKPPPMTSLLRPPRSMGIPFRFLTLAIVRIRPIRRCTSAETTSDQKKNQIRKQSINLWCGGPTVFICAHVQVINIVVYNYL